MRKNSWYGKCYFEYLDNRRWHVKNKNNLCFFVNVLLFRYPWMKLNQWWDNGILKIAPFALFAWYLVYAQIFLKDNVHGELASAFIGVLTIFILAFIALILAISLILGVGTGISHCIIWSIEYKRKSKEEVKFKKGFYGDVVKPYIKAKRQKICPLLKWEE